MKKEKIVLPRFVEVQKADFQRLVMRYPFDDRNFSETETAFGFDREKTLKCFLFSDSGRVAYVHTGYGLYSFEELKLVPTRAYQKECPNILPGQGEKFLGIKEKTTIRLAWEVSEATNFRWTENGVDCDWSSDFFLSYGVVFPFARQPRGLSYLGKTHSLVNEKKEIVGWYIFVDSEADASKIVADEEVR